MTNEERKAHRPVPAGMETVKMVITHGSHYDAENKKIPEGGLATINVKDLPELGHKLATEEEWALLQEEKAAAARLAAFKASHAPKPKPPVDPAELPEPEVVEAHGDDPEAPADEAQVSHGHRGSKRHR